MLRIRAYRPSDYFALLPLFYKTVHRVNSRDYSPAQLDAWAPDIPIERHWKTVFLKHTVLVAEEEGVVCGFATLDGDLFDHLFVSSDYPHHGVGAALAYCLEQTALRQNVRLLRVEASVTAVHFFERRGYQVQYAQKKPCRGEIFLNFVMTKDLRLCDKRLDASHIVPPEFKKKGRNGRCKEK